MKYQFLRFLIPVIMIVVASVNCVLVNTTDHTRWRGGGFGMYSEIHWTNNEIWFNNVPVDIDLVEIHSKLCNTVRRNPSEDNIKKLASAIKRDQGLSNFNIEVWRLSFDKNNLVMNKKKINELFIK